MAGVCTMPRHESCVPSRAGTERSRRSERRSHTSLLITTSLPAGWKHAPPPSLNRSKRCTWEEGAATCTRYIVN